MFLKTETLQYKNGPEKKRVTKTPKPVSATCLLAYFPQVRQLRQVRGVALAPPSSSPSSSPPPIASSTNQGPQSAVNLLKLLLNTKYLMHLPLKEGLPFL